MPFYFECQGFYSEKFHCLIIVAPWKSSKGPRNWASDKVLIKKKKKSRQYFGYKIGTEKAEQNKMKIMEFDNYSMSPIAGIRNK